MSKQELVVNPYKGAKQEIIPVGSQPRLLAVCHDCQKKHIISEHDFLRTDTLRNWEMKHRRHKIEFLCPEAYEVSISRQAVKEYRHNADVKLALATDADYTITLASLAESASLLTGRESTSVDNTSNLYLDYMVSGKLTTGTSPTTNGDEAFEVIAIGPEDDTPTWPDGFSGSDSAQSFSLANVKNAIARYIARIQADDGNSDDTYHFGPVSLASLFGVNPSHHLVWVGHSTGVNLNSTGSNQVITHQGVYATVT